jgi:cardiolipin synthase A/B
VAFAPPPPHCRGRPAVETTHQIAPFLSEEGQIVVHMAERIGRRPVVVGNHVQFLADWDVTIDWLVRDIDEARDHVHLLFYIYADDEVGHRVADALVRARRRGVACRLLADAVGSRRFFKRLAPELRSEQVEVLPSLPVKPFRRPLARLDLRNHRKLAVIDGAVAYMGSQNIIEPSYGARVGKWVDLMARITGPAVAELHAVFLEDWFHETDELLEPRTLRAGHDVGGPATIQVVPTGPDLPTQPFRDLIVGAIFQARRRVVITSPYFVPDEATLLALRLAAQGGLDVRLIMPKRSDHPLVRAAGEFYCEYLMRFGVKVYLFRDGLLHGKTLVIDDELAMFGSANYDMRSFHLNFEVNLLLHGREVVGDLARLQQGYLERSDEAVLGEWPNPTLPGRLRRNLAKLVSPLL